MSEPTPAPQKKRFYKRGHLEFPVVIRLAEFKEQEFLGTFTDISAGGACLRTEKDLEKGAFIDISSLPNASIGLSQMRAQIARVSASEDSKEIFYGVNFLGNSSHAHSINLLIQKQSDLSDLQGLSPIRLILTCGVLLLIPATVAAGMIRRHAIDFKFPLYLGAICLLRFWEIYMRGKETKKTNARGDWTLTAVTFYYILFIEFLAAEFYFVKWGLFSRTASMIGAACLIVSLLLRWWSTKTLGSQWSIRIGTQQDRSDLERSLVHSGPYRFLRHPVYTGYFLELFGLALIPNCYLALLFACLVNIPIQIIRTSIEERELLSLLGEQYAAYMAVTPAFIPFMARSKASGRREIRHVTDFPDRRRQRTI